MKHKVNSSLLADYSKFIQERLSISFDQIVPTELKST